jgi:hypothetical protein
MRFSPSGTSGYPGIDFVLQNGYVTMGHAYEASVANTKWHVGTGGSGTTVTQTVVFRRIGWQVLMYIPQTSITNGNASLSYLEMYATGGVAGAQGLPSDLLPATDVDAGRVSITETATKLDGQVMVMTDGSIRIYKMSNRAAFTSGATTVITGPVSVVWFVGSPSVNI